MTIGNIQQKLKQRQEKGLPIFNLSFADYTFYDTPLLLKKIKKAFANIFRYPYYYPMVRGEPEALDAICEYYARLNRPTNQENLIITPSINHSALYLLRLFSDSEILMSTPFSPYLEEISEILEYKKLKTFPLSYDNKWQIDIAELKKSITSETRAIFIMSPNLPTGAIQKENIFRELFKLIKGKKITVIIDESQSDFVFNKAKLPIATNFADSNQVIVTLQTLSNSFALPGLKLSWIRIDGPKNACSDLMEGLEILSDTFLGVNQLTQGIMPELIRHTRRWRSKFKKTVAKNKDILINKLSKSNRLKFHPPEGGFYAFIEVLPPHKTKKNKKGNSFTEPEFSSAENFCINLMEKTGVYVHPGHYYGQKQGIFFTICFLQSPTTLRNSLKKIVKFLKPRKKRNEKEI